MPTTNPTSTAIFKSLLALKTRNSLILCPHPRAAKCTIEAARIVRDAAVAAGAPPDIISFIETPSLPVSQALMQAPEVRRRAPPLSLPGAGSISRVTHVALPLSFCPSAVLACARPARRCR